ncbi:unnamed protein product [Lymnaea stagnalis]|uniref:Uncharacterized protein n=1 Tax=Lymnaea stagnalis TaxID=6523 RepID=A0AAV2H0I9_LYMST
MPGGQQFVDFLILAVAMEINFATTFPTLQVILNSSKDGDAIELAKGLRSLSQWLKGFKEISKDFHKIMEPDVFFRVIIAYLRGFNETSGLPDGMLYEGVTKQPKRLVINSAASQAAVFQIIDTLLRTEYPPDKEEFFKTLRTTWSSKHRAFLEQIQTWPGNVREMAEKGSNEDLTQAYNELVEAVKEFRTYHVQLVTKFMVIPNKRLRNEFNVQEPDQLVNLMPLLKAIRDDSAKGKIDV